MVYKEMICLKPQQASRTRGEAPRDNPMYNRALAPALWLRITHVSEKCDEAF